MYPEQGNTAESAVKMLKDLMKRRPNHWAENMLDSTANLKDEQEIGKFLKFTSDPLGKTRGGKIDLVPVSSELNLDGLELVDVLPGKVPTYTYLKRAKSCDDEKISLAE